MKIQWTVLLPVMFFLTAAGRSSVTITRYHPPETTRARFPSLSQAHAWLKKLPTSDIGTCLVQVHDSESSDSTLIWTVSGTAASPVTIRGDAGVTLSGKNIKSRAYGKPVLILSWVSHVTLEHLIFYDFDGRKESRIALSITGKGHNVVRDCTFRKFYGNQTEAAISLYNNASYNLIENCSFDSLGDDMFIHAVYLNKDASHNRILNNTISYCSGEVFMVRNGSNYNRFEGNVIRQCSGVAYYGEWYNKQVSPPEKPSRGNMIRRSQNLGPGRPIGYVGHRYIRKVRAMDWSMYKWPRADADLGDSTQAYFIPPDAGNTFVTIPQEMAVEIDSVSGADPAFIRLGREGLYHGQTNPAGRIEGTSIEMFYADTTNRWGGQERFLRQVRIDDNSNKPRRYRTPLQLLTLEGDVVAQMTLERWLGGHLDGPSVQRVAGSGQTITFRIDSLTADYDLFLLPSSLVWNEVKLAGHFKESDGGWDYFYDRAVKTGKGDNTLRALSCNRGSAVETLKWLLREGQTYYLVICARDRGQGTCHWSARP